jgi:transcriptional regulator with XRE-family HTH domain
MIEEEYLSPIGSEHVRAMAEEAARDPEYRAAVERLAFSEGIAREIIRLRAQLKLTQAELARRVGTTPSVISRLERGDHEPSTATLRKIAEATGTRIIIHFARPRQGLRPASQRLAAAGRVTRTVGQPSNSRRELATAGG